MGHLLALAWLFLPTISSLLQTSVSEANTSSHRLVGLSMCQPRFGRRSCIIHSITCSLGRCGPADMVHWHPQLQPWRNRPPMSVAYESRIMTSTADCNVMASCFSTCQPSTGVRCGLIDADVGSGVRSLQVSWITRLRLRGAADCRLDLAMVA